MKEPKSVEDYIEQAPDFAQAKLRQIREIIKKEAPDANEKLSYGMPYYGLNGRLVYFAYFKDHISLFAMPSAIKKFAKQIEPYHHSKGTVGFAYDKPLPATLIKTMVAWRVTEQRAKK